MIVFIFNLLVVISWRNVINFFVIFVVFTSISANADQPKHGPDKWLNYSDTRLGIAFQYPSQYKVWKKNNEVFLDDALLLKHTHQGSKAHERVDLLMNGRSLNDSGSYLIHLTSGQGDFFHANKEKNIFEKSGTNFRLALGRFKNPVAKKIQTHEWKGYESGIICSTEDEETGFHAAGGWCYWSLISNGTQYLVVDTQPIDPRDEKLIHAIVKSVVFLK